MKKTIILAVMAISIGACTPQNPYGNNQPQYGQQASGGIGTGAILGGLAGGAAGGIACNRLVGAGNGKVLATVGCGIVGAGLGGMLGSKLDTPSQPQYAQRPNMPQQQPQIGWSDLPANAEVLREGRDSYGRQCVEVRMQNSPNNMISHYCMIPNQGWIRVPY